MSLDLVKRWRRVARDWRHTAIALDMRGSTDGPSCRERAVILEECAASLELSIKRADARRKKDEGK